jgi:hypothetical protein
MKPNHGDEVVRTHVMSSALSVEVKGGELSKLYRSRAAIHAKRAEEIERRVGVIAKKLRARADELSPEDSEILGLPPQVHSAALGPQNVEYMRQSIEGERRMADYLNFMADHIDVSRSFQLSDHEVRVLVGPGNVGPMVGVGIPGCGF